MADVLDRRPERALFARRLVENLLKHPELEVTLIHFKPMPDDPLYEKAKEIVLKPVRVPWGGKFLAFLKFCLSSKERFHIFQWLVARPYPFFWLAPADKIVVTAHDAGGIAAPGIFTLPRFIFNLMMKYFNRRIDAVIGVSEFARGEIIKFYRIPEQKAFAIYNGIDSELRPIPKIAALQIMKGSYGLDIKKYFLYLGGLQTHKNVKRLIEAYNLFRKEFVAEEKLVIAGIPSYGKEEVYEAARASPYTQDIIFVNYVAVPDLAAIYSGATALVYPSLHEGFGLPIVEAMACGTPVVASDVTSLPEIADAAALLINPNAAQSIADAMLKIITDQKLRADLIVKGFKRARLFTWQKYAEKHRVLYKSLLE